MLCLQVPRDVDEETLRPLLQTYGKIEHINVLRTQRGQSAGLHLQAQLCLEHCLQGLQDCILAAAVAAVMIAYEHMVAASTCFCPRPPCSFQMMPAALRAIQQLLRHMRCKQLTAAD